MLLPKVPGYDRVPHLWVAPIVGAIVGAIIYRVLLDSNADIPQEVSEVRLDSSEAASRADIERTRQLQADAEARRRASAS